MNLNRTSEWKVRTIGNSWELSLFNFDRLNILCVWVGPPSEKLWPFEFLESFGCSISSVSIYYAPKSDIRVKSYDHLNILRASVVQFRVNSYDHLNCSIASTVQFRGSRYIIRLNRTSEWNVMTIWISRELPLFNFERLDILCAWIRSPSDN